MSEMAERVADALMAIEFKMPGAGGLRGTLHVARGQALEMACAAIEAMREPTEEMCSSGDDLSVENYESWAPATLVWRAMIDEAMK